MIKPIKIINCKIIHLIRFKKGKRDCCHCYIDCVKVFDKVRQKDVFELLGKYFYIIVNPVQDLRTTQGIM